MHTNGNREKHRKKNTVWMSNRKEQKKQRRIKNPSLHDKKQLKPIRKSMPKFAELVTR